ncbi:cation:proton antiporter family protein [Colwellia sp. E2M01]|uniref:cation:proton antiporter family protein n=1 Tax=Colwellia sp. E2M01 TaxID=2841561 RepID=UPI001C09980E|nr:cation:proton antiporter family protein [Colwellia sp. E2M01]MBU2871493.1 cation:proton antiporter [Colwellia sp. E2M01]
MDFIWIFFAFICGLAAKTISLPPSIGFLAAGFILNIAGYQADESLSLLSDLGITIMLFTIGLKLNVKNLFKTEVWLGSSLHTILWILGTIAFFKLLALMSISYFVDLDLSTAALIAFALSFSSTVCVIKLLEENGEVRTRHGKLAVSILVIQDIVAVAFLVMATGKTPSVWAFSLLGLFLIKPLVNKVIDHVGHGELIPLTGIFLALGSYELFSLVNIKGDLGALLIGMYLASHTKATEINKALMSFKDIFLIGFFLSIGFTAIPTLEMFSLALLLVLLIPIKFILFYGIFSLLKMRCRSAFLTSLSLSNFSEFGLIVGALSVTAGWLSNDWLVILALSVSISFILTNVIYRFAHTLFAKHRDFLALFERERKLAEDSFSQPAQRPILIVGMGRVGMGAYQAINNHSDAPAWGLDADKDKITWLANKGIDGYYGDAEDIHFWESLDLSRIELVLLALPSVQDSITIKKLLNAVHYKGKIAAVARYEDERAQLEEFGIDKVFNFYTEVGVGFAEESLSLLANKTA